MKEKEIIIELIHDGQLFFFFFLYKAFEVQKAILFRLDGWTMMAMIAIDEV